MTKVCLISVIAGAALATSLGVLSAGDDHGAPADAAVKRARKSVRMLDDVYKTAIVLITEKYVKDANDFPAGGAAVEWFKQISEKGWHNVRLLDATGKPEGAENIAIDDFERRGIQSLKSGKDFVETVEKHKDKYVLRAMTPVPVVLKKCILCHPNYAKAKTGEPIGALSYTLTIE